MKSYYKVVSGALFSIFTKFVEDNKTASAAILEWAKSHPEIESLTGARVRFVDGHTPSKTLWRKHPKGGWTPNKSFKEGKAIAKELEALPTRPNGMNLLMSMMHVSQCKDIMKVNQTGTPGLKHRGEVFYLSCDDIWLPPVLDGIEEIKASEYEAA